MRIQSPDLVALIRSAKGVLLTAHKDPDLDAVGSTLGLWHVCQTMGVPAMVWFADPIPSDCYMLPGAAAIVRTLPASEAYDQVWVLDCSSFSRVRESDALQAFAQGKVVVNLDHHPDNVSFGQYNLTPIISSTSELVFWVFVHQMGEHFVTEKPSLGVSALATCLYAGICFDTGRFLHDNVTADTFSAASALVALGADLALIRDHFFESKSPETYAFMRYVLNHMEVSAKGYVHVSVPAEMVETDIRAVDLIRDLAGVAVAVSFRATTNNEVKVSLRSKGAFNVSTFAGQFGGGGHVKAAGITLSEITLEMAKERILPVLEQALQG